MAGYCTIRGDQFWYDRAVEDLSDAAHRLLMYCFHGPGRTIIGVRRFTLPDVLARFPAWDMDKARAALNELEAAQLVEHDPKARLLFFAPQFDHAPVLGLNSIRGAVKVLEELPDSPALIRPLEHLLQAINLESYKPGGSKAHSELTALAHEFEYRLGKAKTLTPAPEALPGMVPKNKTQADTPLEPPSEGVSGSKTQGETPSGGGREGVSSNETQADTPLGPPSEGVSGSKTQGETPSGGGREGVSSNETQAETPLGPPSEGVSGSKTQGDTPSGGGREGVSPRARARPEQDPDPDPEPYPPLKPPPCARSGTIGSGQPGQGRQEGPEGQEPGKPGGQENGSRYGHLDQRKR